MYNIKSFLNHLTHHPGVYQMLGKNNEVLYVGKAKDLKNRVSSYFNKQAKDLKTAALIKHITDIVITVTASDLEAVLLECNLIKKHRPRYNVLLRDDKSYPYILITDTHPFPKIGMYRGIRKKNGLYFGPYPNSKAVKETIQYLQKIFQLRTCDDHYYDHRTRPFLLYQIGRCTGPCVGLINQEAYAENVQLAVLFLRGKNEMVIKELQSRMEKASQELNFERAARYRDQIARLRQIQEQQCINTNLGDADAIGIAIQSGGICIQILSIRNGQVLGSDALFPSVPTHTHEAEIISSFITQHYLNHPSHTESIPKLIIVDIDLPDGSLLEHVLSQQSNQKVQIRHVVRGEKKKWLHMAALSAKQSLAAHLFNKMNIQERLFALQKILHLHSIPKRIECFDISHTMGEATVGSCVVFNEDGPLKSDYRRFNISDITKGDDVAALRQSLLRRFKSAQSDAKIPDLIIIDGGKAQLTAAKKTMDELQIDEITLMSISKGPNRKPGLETLHFIDKNPIHIPADSLVLHFIQQIRDEAHRFAITGHRQRRDKSRRQSVLETIPGIGAKRRRDLLRYFGGIQGLAHASLDELTKVPGISHSLAKKIFTALHDATTL
jgi:excinuclease ABC subunit C